MAAKKTRKPKQKASKRAAKVTRSTKPARASAKKKAPARAKAAPKKAPARKAAKPKRRPEPKRPAAKKAVKKAVVKKAAVKKKALKKAVKKASIKKPLKKVSAPKAQRSSKKAAKSKAQKPSKKLSKKASAPKPVKAKKAAKPAKAAKALKPAKAAKPAKPAKPAKAPKPSKPVKLVKQAKAPPPEPSKPAKKASKVKAAPAKAPAPSKPEKLEKKLSGAKAEAKAPSAPGKRPISAPPIAAPSKSASGKSVPGKSAPGKSVPGKSDAPLAKRSDRPSEAGSKKRSSAPPAAPPSARKKGSAPLAREPAPRIVTLPLPMMAPPKRPSIEERAATIEKRLAAQTDDFRKRYIDSFDMSWIYHDSALEGVVYTFEELRSALSGQVQPVTDSSLQPTYDDIRRHKEAIDFVRDFGEKKRLPVTVDIIKKIYLILHPEEGDIKTVKYRKDIPQHRLYFHEYAPPDKIAYKVRQIVDWLNDPETRKTRNGIRIAARAHYDLLRVYPFPTDSGKSARLFMNLLLMRTGLPPAILHSTERQRYYEALKGSATTVLQMVQEAVENALSSVEKLLDEHETRKRAFVS